MVRHADFAFLLHGRHGRRWHREDVSVERMDQLGPGDELRSRRKPQRILGQRPFGNRGSRRVIARTLPGVISLDYLQLPQSLAVGIHLRALIGWDQPLRAIAKLPEILLLGARWWARGHQRLRMGRLSVEFMEAYAEFSGVTLGEQRHRLSELQRRQTIPALDAYRFRLIAEQDRCTDWSHFIYSSESGWNLAASLALRNSSTSTERSAGRAPKSRAIRANLYALSDKVDTIERLRAVTVPTVATLLVKRSPRCRVDGLLERAYLLWPDASGFFVKPRFGSGGRDSFVVTRPAHLSTTDSARSTPRCLEPQNGSQREWNHHWLVNRYKFMSEGPSPAEEDLQAFELALERSDYLVQPLLRSASMWDDLANPTDVVTLRVVTRDAGGGPAVFSRVLEIPLPPKGTERRYLMAGVKAEGTVAKLAIADFAIEVLGAQKWIEWQELMGRHLVDAQQIDKWATKAHDQFPGVFAIAWDVALSASGAVFLEGNTGFGTLEAQLVAGGLLDFSSSSP